MYSPVDMHVNVFLGEDAPALAPAAPPQQSFWQWLFHKDSDLLGDSADWYCKQPWYMELPLFPFFVLACLGIFVFFAFGCIGAMLYYIAVYPLVLLYRKYKP